jgi:hypothetical protein
VVELEITREAGRTNVIEASTNLTDWVPVRAVLNPSGTLPFIDLTAANYRQRFYRAVLPP